MTKEEEEYQKQLEDAGVEIPDDSTADDEGGETPEQKAEAAAQKAKADEDAKAKADADNNADDKKTPEPTEKKRSIYDDYKDKKQEAKTEKERADQAELERDELKQKLEALETAKTPEQKKDAQDELEAFAEEINMDPAPLKKMRELFLKGLKPDESLQKDMLEFKEWKAEQSKVTAKNQFEDEFSKALPSLKKSYFPTASDDEMRAIKVELDKLSHSKGWNDKELEYIAFKHKDSLSALISPKKRGMESMDRKDSDESSTDFNPEADYSKMSPAQREIWEKQYNETMKKAEGLATNAQGKKIFI